MTDHTNTQTDVKPCDPITPVESAESSESVVDIEYPHSEWYYEPNANLEIVTSDGILIRLEAYRLQASSALFGEMIRWEGNGQCGRITLCDQELETASVLHGLLDVMVKNTNILDLGAKAEHHLTRRQLVIQLAQKYGFKREIHSMHQDLRLGLYVGKRNPWCVLELAARLDDSDLCCDAIKKSCIWTIKEGAPIRGEGEFGNALPGVGLFDIRTYSLELMKALPIEVIWALSRASHSYVKLADEPLKKAHIELGQGYHKLMAMKGAPRFPFQAGSYKGEEQ